MPPEAVQARPEAVQMPPELVQVRPEAVQVKPETDQKRAETVYSGVYSDATQRRERGHPKQYRER